MSLSKQFATPVLREAFYAMTFKSQLTPAIRVDDPFRPTPDSFVGSLVKPQVTLHSKLGDQVIEPWGTPRGWVFPVAVAGVVIALVGIGYLIGKRTQ